MAARHAHHRAVAMELNAVHQAAHQENSEAAAAFFDRCGIATLAGKTPSVIANIDGELTVVEFAVHGEPIRTRGFAMFDGITQRLARRETNVGHFLLRKAADPRKAGNSVAGQWHVFSVARESGAIIWIHSRFPYPLGCLVNETDLPFAQGNLGPSRGLGWITLGASAMRYKKPDNVLTHSSISKDLLREANQRPPDNYWDDLLR